MEITNSVKFSVIIPAHNEEGFIGDCLESIEAADDFYYEVDRTKYHPPGPKRRRYYVVKKFSGCRNSLINKKDITVKKYFSWQTFTHFKYPGEVLILKP
jgi:hypothetical protein